MTAPPKADRYPSLVPFDRSTLDARPDKPANAKSVRWLVVLGLLIGGGAFGYTAAGSVASFTEIQVDETVPDKLPGLWKLSFLISLPVTGFVAILAHEVGHVIGGKLAGMKFLLLIVGPLKISSDNGRRTVGWNSSLAMAGGLACCLPNDPTTFLKELRWLIAGGPLASLLLSVVALGLSWLPFAFLPEAAGRFAAFFFGTLSLFSFLIFLFTVLPGSAGNFKTDGRQFWELVRNDEHTAKHNLLRMLAGQSMAGIRPRNWDAATVDTLDRLHDLTEPDSKLPDSKSPKSKPSNDERTANVSWAALRSSRANDVGDLDTRHRCLTYCIANADAYPEIARGSLYFEAAKFEADVRGDIDAAQWLIDAAPPGMLVEAHDEPMARAAVARARGDDSAARLLAREAFDKVDSAIDRGCIEMVKEYLQPMLEPENRSDTRQPFARQLG